MSIQSWFSKRNDALGNLESIYRADNLKSDVNQTCIAISLWQLPNLFFSYSDYCIFGENPEFWHLLLVRLFILITSLYAIHLFYKVETPDQYDHIYAVWVAVGTGAILFINATWAPHVPPNNTITVLLLFSAYMLFPNKLLFRMFPAITITAGNIGVYWYLGKSTDYNSAYLMLIAFVIANLFGIVFSTQMQDFRRREFIARREESIVKEELRRLASTDELTGVHNRRKLIELAEIEFELFKRTGNPFSVLMIDFDFFKHLNDSYGHQAGDLILVEFSSFISRNIRPKDVWGRLGGEEFVLVLPFTSRDDAEKIGDRFRIESSQMQIRIGDGFPSFTISIGVAEAERTDISFAETLKRADLALYRAKLNGRNRIEVA